MSAQLPISKVIQIAKQKKLSLGNGDPEQHLFYLGKLGLLPRAVKKKVNGKIEGHYGEEVIGQIELVSQLKNRGLTYSQMKLILNSQSFTSLTEGSTPKLAEVKTFDSNPIAQAFPKYQQLFASSPLAFLVIGLVLGYLITFKNFSAPTTSAAAQNTDNTITVTDISALSPAEKALTKVLGSSNHQDQTIYVISEPKNSLTNLGKTKINLE